MERHEVRTTPPIHQLSIGRAFSSLTQKEKLYAHHMSRAAWHGIRIVLSQVSPESTEIYDFILSLHIACGGEWSKPVGPELMTKDECDSFLRYAGTFLSKVGNHYGSGDQKFIPAVSVDSVKKVASHFNLDAQFQPIAKPMMTVPPYGLGFPGDGHQSAYYPGQLLDRKEIEAVSRAMEKAGIYPENTRISKTGENKYTVSVASCGELDGLPTNVLVTGNVEIKIAGGDHAKELTKICKSLLQAKEYAANDRQKLFLDQYIRSFESGSLDAYRDSQRTWIQDKNPRVENIFGFVEPYRDPYGIRSEFEGLVAISDAEETSMLAKLVDHSAKFIKRLPWAVDDEADNGGKGPFEKDLFEPPDFTSIHALAYCSSIIFPGINLPNYNDIRQECGFKNVIVANRMSAESNTTEISPFVDPSEAEQFTRHRYPAYYWWVVLHELLGHGTGRMMVEETPGKYNFDIKNPPVDPLTLKPITSWYKPGQTWTGQFGDLATTVDECRAELVGAYLMDDPELLRLFGFDEGSDISAEDLTYNVYMQLGTDGLRGMCDYDPDSKTWGQAHSRAHFATLKCLLEDSNGCVRVECDPAARHLIVRVDRSMIVSHGKPALGNMLLRLHMYRCTANVTACRKYYEGLSSVNEEQLAWRDIYLEKRRPKWIFTQANTFLEGENVVLKEYEPTAEGIIRSWADRDV